MARNPAYLEGLKIGWELAKARRNPTNIRTCPVCGKVFKRRGKRKLNAKLIYCSRACQGKTQIGRLIPGFNLKSKHSNICQRCGALFFAPRSHHAKFCSDKCLRIGRASIRGSRHYNWKGGISTPAQKARNTPEMLEWTRSVFRRDEFKCRICGKGRELNAHHLFHFAEFPHLRSELSNGITLCEVCHTAVHVFGRKFNKKIADELNIDMRTVAQSVDQDKGHWYFPDGKPCHEVENQSNGGMRQTTLRDARKLGLLPSVTQVLRIIEKPALNAWKTEQALLAALTTPRLDGESDDAFVHRVLHVERQQDQESQQARDRGTEIHAAMESLFRGERVSPELEPYVRKPYEALMGYGEVWATEKVLVGQGYAGTADLIQRTPLLWRIWDYKSAKSIPKEPYLEHKLQLSGYGAALRAIPEVGFTFPIVVGNVYISTKEPGMFAIYEHENWTGTFAYGFESALQLWQWMNQYYPEQ